MHPSSPFESFQLLPWISGGGGIFHFASHIRLQAMAPFQQASLTGRVVNMICCDRFQKKFFGRISNGVFDCIDKSKMYESRVRRITALYKINSVRKTILSFLLPDLFSWIHLITDTLKRDPLSSHAELMHFNWYGYKRSISSMECQYSICWPRMCRIPDVNTKKNSNSCHANGIFGTLFIDDCS